MEHTVEIKDVLIKDITSSDEIKGKCRYLMHDNPYKEYHSTVIEGRVDGITRAKAYIFPVRMIYNGKTYPIISGSTFAVPKEYRKYDLGMLIPEHIDERNPNCLFAGMSKDAQLIYRYLGFSIFDISRYVFIINSHFLVSLKLKGFLSKIVTFLSDVALHLVYVILKLIFKFKYCKFKIIEKNADNIDYDGVERIIASNSFPYREDHGREWIKWVMNYSDDHKESKQHFYEIYRNKKLVGFFLNKNKYRELLNGKYKNVIYGTILEWGSIDQNVLRDSDICAIAFSKFGIKTDAVAMCSTDESFFNRIPKFLRKKMGDLNYVVKFDKKEFPDYKRQENWRIRPAGGDASF